MSFFNQWMANPMTQVGIGLLSDPNASFGDLMAQQAQKQHQQGLLALEQEQMDLKRQELEAALAAQQQQQAQQQQLAGLLALDQRMPSDGIGPPDMIQAGYDQQMFEAMPELMQKVAESRYLPKEPAADPTSIREYNFALSQGYKGSYMDFVAEKGASSAQQVKISIGDQLTPAQEALDKEYAKSLVGFETGGQFADSEKQIQQLEEALQAIVNPKTSMSGTLVGNTPDWILAIANPEALDTRETIEEIVQRNLREVLGAQFTEKEGERLISRAYNPRLSDDVNAKRVARLLAQMKLAYRTKTDAANYLRENGTIRGWGGKLPTFSDFYEAINRKGSSAKELTDEELMRELAK